MENSIFDAIENVGRGKDDGSSEGKITSGGFKASKNGSQRKNVERQNSKGNSNKQLNNGPIRNKIKNEKRILNNNNGNRGQNTIRDDAILFPSSNNRINPYKDYVNTAGNSFKFVFKLINDDLYRLPNVLERPKLPQISFLLLEPILKIE